MKQFILFLLVLISASQVFAGSPVIWSSDNKAKSLNSGGILLGNGHMVNSGNPDVVNIMKNPGFEKSTYSDNYTASGSSALAAETTNPAIGVASAKWDASATGEYLTADAVTIPAGLRSQNCQVSTWYKWALGTSGDIKLQAYDGTNVLVEVELATAADWTPVYAAFVCPSSGSLSWRLASTANAAEITIDQNYIGKQSNLQNVDQPQIVAHAYKEYQGSCAWSYSSSSMAAPADDTDCTATVVEFSTINVNTTDTDQPDLVFDYLPPGRYVVHASFMQESGTSTSQIIGFGINDGTDTNGTQMMMTDATQTKHPVHLTAGFSYEVGGAKTFTVYGRRTSGTLFMRLVETNARLTWTVIRYPLNPVEAVNLDTQGWYIDANIVATTRTNLSGTSQTSYRFIDDGDLTLTQNSGSQAVKIACESAVSTGTTCSGVDELVGVDFDIPKSGSYLACFNFGHRLNVGSGGAANVVWQVVETNLNDQTILQEGKTRVASANNTASTSVTHPVNNCGLFTFDSASEKRLQIMYESSITATVTENQLDNDGSASLGQRDVHIYIYPLTQQFPQAVAINNVETGGTTSGCTNGNICSGAVDLDTLNIARTGGDTATVAGEILRWVRVGEQYSFSGAVSLTSISGSGTITLDFDQFSSTLDYTSVYDCTGVVSHNKLTVGASGWILADTSNDTIELRIGMDSDTTDKTITFTGHCRAE